MYHLDVPQFLGMLVVMLAAAKLLGALAQRIGQPAVLGELLAGVILSPSIAGFVDPKNESLHLLAELGVIILLFEIGLETDLKKLLKVGGTSAAVAMVGVALPFILGYVVCRVLGLDMLVGVVAGAALTATSVGITARVLSDLKRLQEPESQIILGAAVIDDVIGLVILAVVAKLSGGQEVTTLGVVKSALGAFGFLGGILLIGGLVIRPLARRASHLNLPGSPTMLAVMLALGLAWLASVAGSALIIGAFAAGLLLRETPQAREMERGVAHLGHFFVPLFFVTVGAAVDVRVLNPANSANWQTLLIGGLLILVAVLGKYAAGFAPFWFKGNKSAIGVGMIPRGEVGLIFAHKGLASGILSAGLFSAVTMMVMVTTFMTPPLLRLVFPARDPAPGKTRPEGIEDLVMEG